jgi:hypothetical protein
MLFYIGFFLLFSSILSQRVFPTHPLINSKFSLAPTSVPTSTPFTPTTVAPTVAATTPPLQNQPYRDITCPKYKCSKEKMQSINYAKSLGLGSFTCIASLIIFNLDGSLNFTTSYPSSYVTYYNETMGAIVTDSPDGGRNEEYCNDYNSICLNENQLELVNLYSESHDISKGGVGNAARFIQSYEKTSGRKLRRFQHLVITDQGENVFISLLDENQRYLASLFQTCKRVYFK